MRRPVPPMTVLMFLVGGIGALFGTYWDDAWHTDRGRDSFTIAPHLLLYVGLFAVGSGMLMAVGLQPGRRGYLVTSAVGALVLCVSLAPVMEYESDAPQFASVWYLPVLTVGSIIALTLLHAASGRHWIGTASALLSTGLRTGIVLFLLLLGFSLPLLPLIIIPALVFDATARWRMIQGRATRLVRCA